MSLKRTRRGDERLWWVVLADLGMNFVAALVLVAIVLVGSRYAGVRLLEGWTLLGALIVLAVATIVAIAVVARRRLRIRGQVSKGKFVDTNLE